MLLRIGMRSYSPTLMLWRPALWDTFGCHLKFQSAFLDDYRSIQKDAHEYHTLQIGMCFNNFREMESDSVKIGFSYAVRLSKTQHYFNLCHLGWHHSTLPKGYRIPVVTQLVSLQAGQVAETPDKELPHRMCRLGGVISVTFLPQWWFFETPQWTMWSNGIQRNWYRTPSRSRSQVATNCF